MDKNVDIAALVTQHMENLHKSVQAIPTHLQHLEITKQWYNEEGSLLAKSHMPWDKDKDEKEDKKEDSKESNKKDEKDDEKKDHKKGKKSHKKDEKDDDKDEKEDKKDMKKSFGVLALEQFNAVAEAGGSSDDLSKSLAELTSLLK